jgi:hypothetical protein
MAAALLVKRAEFRLPLSFVYMTISWLGQLHYSPHEIQVGGGRRDHCVFNCAGTPSVITTLWKVNDRASFELMNEFYLQLKTQKKSAALRQAQLKTMKEFPEPFFWAVFGLTGEP